MALTLGKSFDRNYNMRIPFLDGYYNVGVFFNKRSTFLLFKIEPDFSKVIKHKTNVKVNMFKNLESSKFCETFINLHNYKKNTLDIINQFENIKPEYFHEISFIFNETLTLSKTEIVDKTLFDTLTLYGFTLNNFINEFVFILAERQNIDNKLNKKVVRTSGIQIATSSSIELMNEFHEDSKISGREGTRPDAPKQGTIKIN